MNQSQFFELFALPTTFEIDKIKLKDAFLNLQKQHHPDLSDAKQASTYQSSLINHAYQVLLHDDSRAAHLLELAGQTVDLSKSIDDWDFLDRMMDLRIQLEDENNQCSLSTVLAQVDTLSQAQAEKFTQAYNQKQWDDALDSVKKLQFLEKLKLDIDDRIRTSTLTTNDDDLYV